MYRLVLVIICWILHVCVRKEPWALLREREAALIVGAHEHAILHAIRIHEMYA